MGTVIGILINTPPWVFVVLAAMKLNVGFDVAIAAQAISGACAGYFLGWTIALLRSTRAQTAVAPQA